MKRKQKDIDYRDRKLIFVDLEMTGLNPEIHEIVQIAALVVDGENLKIKKEFETKVKPKHLETASKEALKISGYSGDLWSGAKSLENALIDFNRIARDGILAGWAINVDYMFLELGFARTGITPLYDYHVLDIPSLAYEAWYERKDIRLLEMRKLPDDLRPNLPEETHDALDDIRATYNLFKKIVERK